MAHIVDFYGNQYFGVRYFGAVYFGIGEDVHTSLSPTYSETVGLGIIGLGI